MTIMGLDIVKFEVGMDTNCYIVTDEAYLDAFILDPGFFETEFGKILGHLSSTSSSIVYIINTHGHPDHTSGNRQIKMATGAPILIHKDDEIFLSHLNWPTLIGNLYHELPCPNCGKVSKPIYTIKDNSTTVIMQCTHCGPLVHFDASTTGDQYLQEGNKLVLGDTEFIVLHTPGHSLGGVCLYCKKENLLFSGDTLFNNGTGRVDIPFSDPEDMQKSLLRLWELPDETRILPGHGPETTIGAEKKR